MAGTCELSFPASFHFTHHRFPMTESQHIVRSLRKGGLFLAGALARPADTLGKATSWAGLSVGACPLAHHTDPPPDPKRRKREPEQLGGGPGPGSLEVG